jgi:hypothetical protein
MMQPIAEPRSSCLRHLLGTADGVRGWLVATTWPVTQPVERQADGMQVRFHSRLLEIFRQSPDVDRNEMWLNIFGLPELAMPALTE